MKLSFSFMSVPERHENVEQIKKRLITQIQASKNAYTNPTIHEDTHHKGPWDSWKSAWSLKPEGTTHHIVLQDDILLCEDFPDTMHALAVARPLSPISGFLPRKSVDKAAQQNLHWVETKRFLWGQCLMMPVTMGDTALSWIKENEGSTPGWSHHDDVRLAAFFSHIGTPVFVAVPHPVEHIGDQLGSVLKHYGPAGKRRGRAWLGENTPLSGLNWKDLKCVKE